jgi:IS5 family transposase
MTRRTAIQPDLFAAEEHRAKLERLGDPLQEMEAVIDFAALAAAVEKIAPLKDQPKGGRPPYPIETMVRIVVLKRLYGLSDEQMEFQLLDRMSFKRFCGLEHSRTVPDRTTIWLFENRIGAAGAQALFEAVKRQIERKGYIARGGQIVDATLVRAPRQHLSREEREIVERRAMPRGWSPAKRRQKDLDPSWTKKHGKSHYGYKLSVCVDRKHKLIRRLKTDTASTHDSQHFEALLDSGNTCRDVYADRGYASKEREETLQAKGKRQSARNTRIARVRARSSTCSPRSNTWAARRSAPWDAEQSQDFSATQNAVKPARRLIFKNKSSTADIAAKVSLTTT